MQVSAGFIAYRVDLYIQKWRIANACIAPSSVMTRHLLQCGIL